MKEIIIKVSDKFLQDNFSFEAMANAKDPEIILFSIIINTFAKDKDRIEIDSDSVSMCEDKKMQKNLIHALMGCLCISMNNEINASKAKNSEEAENKTYTEASESD